MTAGETGAGDAATGAEAAGGPRARARRRALAAAAILGALFVLNAVWIARSVRGLHAGGAVAAVGAPAPDFRGRLLAGGTLGLEGLRGRVVLLEFWATWCAPCVAEMPSLVRAHERLGARGLAVVGVNIEGAAAAAAVRDFVAEAGLPFPVVLDDGAIAGAYRVRALPHTVVIGRDGVVRRVLLGAPPEGELEAILEDALR